MSGVARRAILAGVLTLAASAARASEVRVEKIWSRATAPGADTAAIYLTLRSVGGADRLIGVDTAEAGMAMLHQTKTAGGVSTMRDVAAIDLPAGADVSLSPGAGHVMLMGLARPLRKGDHFTVTLRFATAPPVTLQVPVAGIGAVSPP